METTDAMTTKPGTIKTIQVLMITKIFLALAFYFVFTALEKNIGNYGPIVALYTSIGYAIMAAIVIYFINRKRLLTVRIFLIADLLVSIPATAVIGIVFSLISFALTFMKSARNYFMA